MHRHSGFLLSTLHNPRVSGGGVSQTLPHDGPTHPLDPEDIVFPPPTEDEPSIRSPLERSVGSIVETLTALVHTVEALERKFGAFRDILVVDMLLLKVKLTSCLPDLMLTAEVCLLPSITYVASQDDTSLHPRLCASWKRLARFAR